MQNKILIAVIIALLGVICVNSAFKNGGSVGKEIITIEGHGNFFTVNKNNGEFEIKKSKTKEASNITEILSLISDYESKGYKIIASNLALGGPGYGFYFLLEKE